MSRCPEHPEKGVYPDKVAALAKSLNAWWTPK